VPVKQRTAKARRPVFAPEVIALFVELERLPRQSPRFEEGSRALAEKLGLMDEWFTMQHVNDRSAGPCHPPWLVAHGDWFRCRRVREQLLAAAHEAGLRVAGG
jgi:hypothetical protein